MRPRVPGLTEQELEIMKHVWQLESATVRDVYEKLLKKRKIAYTTVMTMMKILEQKGHLVKSTDDRAHVYRPSKPREEVLGGMVNEFVDRVFNGAAEPLLMHLVENEKLTEADLTEIQKMLRRKK